VILFVNCRSSILEEAFAGVGSDVESMRFAAPVSRPRVVAIPTSVDETYTSSIEAPAGKEAYGDPV